MQAAKVRKPETWTRWMKRGKPVDRETVIKNAPLGEWDMPQRERVERIERNVLWGANDPHEQCAEPLETPFGTYYCEAAGKRTVYVLQDGERFYLACDDRPVVDLRSWSYLSLYEALQGVAQNGFTHYRMAGGDPSPIADVPPPPIRSILDPR